VERGGDFGRLHPVLTALTITQPRGSHRCLANLINEGSIRSRSSIGRFPRSNGCRTRFREPAPCARLKVMTETYSVLWRDGNGPIYAGTIEPGARGLRLEGSCHGRNASFRTIRYEDLARLRFTRAAADCLYGKLTLRLQLDEGGAVGIASVNDVGVLRDLERQISAFAPNLRVA
jgi:hypothetical protein